MLTIQQQQQQQQQEHPEQQQQQPSAEQPSSLIAEPDVMSTDVVTTHDGAELRSPMKQSGEVFAETVTDVVDNLSVSRRTKNGRCK